MTRFFLFGLIINFSLQVNALEPTETASAYEHLCEVNSQWRFHRDAAPKVNVSFRDENERIRFHLQNVVIALKDPKISSNKDELLERLWSYAENQEFPSNLGHQGRRPYFIDYKDTHCAVGFLMKESGNEELAKRISQSHNYDFIQDIKTKGIPEWAEQYGFSEAELAWIQPGYLLENIYSPVQGELNGRVRGMVSSYQGDRMLLYGDFDSISGVGCEASVAMHDGVSVQCFNNGLSGHVNDAVWDMKFAVAGDLTLEGIHYPVVLIEEDTIIGLSIPDRPNAIGISYSDYATQQYFVIEGASELYDEIWRYRAIYDSWFLLAEVYGSVKGIRGNKVYGVFDTVHYNVSSLNDTMVTTHNMISLAYVGNPPIAASVGMPDTVNCVLDYGNVTYVGGTSEIGNPILVSYLNDVIQPLKYASDPYYHSILSMTYGDQNTLALVGDFAVVPSTGYAGTNFGIYTPASNYLSPLGVFHEPVNAVSKFQDMWHVGGDFVEDDFSYLAKLTGYMSVNDFEDVDIGAYPNPTSDILNLTVSDSWNGSKNVQVFDPQGRLVLSDNFLGSQHRISLDDLASGKYVLVLDFEKLRSTSVIIKN